jgi:hypothetical protein
MGLGARGDLENVANPRGPLQFGAKTMWGMEIGGN